MANVVITSTTNTILFVFNTYANDIHPEKACWHKSSAHFSLTNNDVFVKATEDNGQDLDLTFDGANGSMQVDSVDGVAPTSNADLYTKLTALIA